MKLITTSVVRGSHQGDSHGGGLLQSILLHQRVTQETQVLYTARVRYQMVPTDSSARSGRFDRIASMAAEIPASRVVSTLDNGFAITAFVADEPIAAPFGPRPSRNQPFM